MRKPDRKVTEAEIADSLIKAALAGHKEKCLLCGEEVVSVALHFFSCSKAQEARDHALGFVIFHRPETEAERQELKRKLKREVRGPKEAKRKAKVEEKTRAVWDV